MTRRICLTWVRVTEQWKEYVGRQSQRRESRRRWRKCNEMECGILKEHRPDRWWAREEIVRCREETWQGT